jgi:hypothetical protein
MTEGLHGEWRNADGRDVCAQGDRPGKEGQGKGPDKSKGNVCHGQ